MGHCTQAHFVGRERVQIKSTTEADPVLDLVLKSKGLPELAFIDNSDGLASTNAKVVAVKRGVPGCYAVETESTADELNAKHGVTSAQREAMRFGSMFGWGSRLATPQAWENEGH